MKNPVFVFYFIALFLSSACFSFSQSQKFNQIIDRGAIKCAKNTKYEQVFLTITRLNRKKNWDSILIVTNKLTYQKPPIQILDYIYYYRNRAFSFKDVYQYALVEINKISSTFEFADRALYEKACATYMNNKYKESLVLFHQIDTTKLIVKKTIPTINLLSNMSLAYSQLEDFHTSIRYLKEAERISNIQKDTNFLAFIYYNLGADYEVIKQLDKSILYHEKSYALAKNLSDLKLKVSVTSSLALVYNRLKNYKQSAKYWDEHRTLSDSLNDQNSIYQVAELEKKAALTIKQKEVEKLEATNQLRKTRFNFVILFSSLLLLLLVLILYFYRQKANSSKIISTKNAELDKLNKTKDQLFSIVSHDLRSSVNALKVSNANLKNLAEKKEYLLLDEKLEENSQIAGSTYTLLDNLLSWSLLQTKGTFFNQETHRLAMLIEQVSYNYTSVLKQKGLEFENKVPKSTKVYVDQETLKLVFRNLMDNSMKFSTPGGKITANLVDESFETITLSWSDQGKGMSEETRSKILSDSEHLTKKDHENEIGSGLGMNLVKSMVLKNGGKLDIKSELGTGTNILITLLKNTPHTA